MNCHLASLLLLSLGATRVASFHVKSCLSPSPCSPLFSNNHQADGEAASMMQQVYAIGTFVEFEEKKRVHIGTVSEKEQKSNGVARYKVVDKEGKLYSIADKAVHFAMNAPNSPGQATKLFDDFCNVYEASEEDLEMKLDVSTDLLEVAWEESSLDGAELTPSGLVELVHAHTASAIEKYMAWRFLQTQSAHVFFKEIKDHGRVISFKAKAKTAVDAAKQAFCETHGDSELCLV
eukprot:scaffold991_cov128-Cylindrotheca_fusiformis.AAC.9